MMKDGTENVYMFVNFSWSTSDKSRKTFDLIFLYAIGVLNFLAINFYSIFKSID